MKDYYGHHASTTHRRENLATMHRHQMQCRILCVVFKSLHHASTTHRPRLDSTCTAGERKRPWCTKHGADSYMFHGTLRGNARRVQFWMKNVLDFRNAFSLTVMGLTEQLAASEVLVRAWFPLLPVVPLQHKNCLSSTSSSLLFFSSCCRFSWFVLYLVVY